MHVLSIFHASDDNVLNPTDVEELFACMDADGGGTVTRTELETFIKATARAATKPGGGAPRLSFGGLRGGGASGGGAGGGGKEAKPCIIA